MIVVGAVCVVFAFLYTAGPYPLAYHGWGDGLVIVFFGFVPVGVTYYVLCHGWTTEVTVVSLACGMVIDTLLMVNNYRDREQDAQSGKRTLVVRFGPKAGSLAYLTLGIVASGLCLTLLSGGYFAAGYSAGLPAVSPGSLATDGTNPRRPGTESHPGKNVP